MLNVAGGILIVLIIFGAIALGTVFIKLSSETEGYPTLALFLMGLPLLYFGFTAIISILIRNGEFAELFRFGIELPSLIAAFIAAGR